MIYAEIVHGLNGLKEQYRIRREVFVKEQGMDENTEKDGLDKECLHVLVFDNKEAVGTGRVINTENGPLIGRIAVLKEYRGNQYGDLIVRKLVDCCFRQGEKSVEVHSQLPVIKFYTGIGFEISGEEFLENGKTHISMIMTKDNFKSKCGGL
jgi:predicted GNAT family N-acyltransferase